MRSAADLLFRIQSNSTGSDLMTSTVRNVRMAEIVRATGHLDDQAVVRRNPESMQRGRARARQPSADPRRPNEVGGGGE